MAEQTLKKKFREAEIKGKSSGNGEGWLWSIVEDCVEEIEKLKRKGKIWEKRK